MVRSSSVALVVLLALLVTSCALKFAGHVPSSDVLIVGTGTGLVDPAKYEAKGLVCVQRTNVFFDILGLISPQGPTLSQALTESMRDELADEARKLGANAVLNCTFSYSYVPGCIVWGLPIGFATVELHGTAVKLTRH